MKNLLLGIDVGTSSTKSIIVDETGKILGSGTGEYKIDTPHPGWVEQEPKSWILGIKKSVKKAVNNSTIEWSEIAGIGLTHQRLTIVPVDEEYNPIYPAIVWNDTRADKENEWASKKYGVEQIFKRTGYVPGLWSIYKMMWLKNNKPQIYDNTHQFHMVSDWLIYKLTGKVITTEGAAVTSGALDIKEKVWAEDFIEEMGIDINKFVPKILPGGKTVGKVTKKAEELFGIPAGIPVVTAAGDQPCGSFGAGQFETGSLAINGGTSCTSEVLTSKLPSREHTNYFVEISPTGDYILENSIYSGASTLMKWYKNNFGMEEVKTAAKEEKNKWEVIYALAGKAPVGNLGLFLIPFFKGAGAPYWNLNSRGALLGLTDDHGRKHLVRAIIEGLAYETRKASELMEEDMAESITNIVNYGGSNKSDIWNQTFADICNKKVKVSEIADTTALGAAMCAAAGIGIYPNVYIAGKNMSTKSKVLNPRKGNVDFYDEFYKEIYKGIYDEISTKLAKGRTLALQHIGE